MASSSSRVTDRICSGSSASVARSAVGDAGMYSLSLSSPSSDSSSVRPRFLEVSVWEEADLTALFSHRDSVSLSFHL